jgi:cbb3-type cytochrome oxidase subunit 3
MRLVDIMSHSGLAGYAEIAMVLFVVAFAVIVATTYWPGRRKSMNEASRLPLQDDPASGREEENRS